MATADVRQTFVAVAVVVAIAAAGAVSDVVGVIVLHCKAQCAREQLRHRYVTLRSRAHRQSTMPEAYILVRCLPAKLKIGPPSLVKVGMVAIL
jgi:hypothetical protein